ncbi:hypothetical protein HMPREF1981_02523 [Bacteroides pyogenes F0041]|uniref:Uncharacterized protein n=1 Tax=Bacteroides pyogenes F0041 TaxID=1321819 RepID=U2CH97_9BACE|nr:hypothetical protein HMPREF1981_02523 [Bacteroides pyogenes F0041]
MEHLIIYIDIIIIYFKKYILIDFRVFGRFLQLRQERISQ